MLIYCKWLINRMRRAAPQCITMNGKNQQNKGHSKNLSYAEQMKETARAKEERKRKADSSGKHPPKSVILIVCWFILRDAAVVTTILTHFCLSISQLSITEKQEEVAHGQNNHLKEAYNRDHGYEESIC